MQASIKLSFTFTPKKNFQDGKSGYKKVFSSLFGEEELDDFQF